MSDRWGEAYGRLNTALEAAKDVGMTDEEVMQAVDDVYGDLDEVGDRPPDEVEFGSETTNKKATMKKEPTSKKKPTKGGREVNAKSQE